MLLVTYDVNTTTPAGRKRLHKVAKICENCGQRVQNSVFECSLDYAQSLRLKKQLTDVMDRDLDSLRLYNLGNNWKNRVEHIGAKPGYDPEGVIMI